MWFYFPNNKWNLYTLSSNNENLDYENVQLHQDKWYNVNVEINFDSNPILNKHSGYHEMIHVYTLL